jgi:hypothetical protein
LSVFDDFSSHISDCNQLKTQDVGLGASFALPFHDLQETVVIIFALVAALILLVAVTLISSIDSSRTRRH